MADSLPQNVTTFAWTKGKAQAAVRLAEDHLSDEQIAEEAGVNRRTLDRWKHHPEFAARVKEHVAEMAARAQRRGFARRERRIDRYNRRLDEIEQVRSERAADPEMTDVPGGSTGLVVRQLKTVRHVFEKDPNDPDARASSATVEIWEHALDTGLIREERKLLQQLAQDIGQWAEKHEITGPDGASLITMVEVVLPADEDGERGG